MDGARVAHEVEPGPRVAEKNSLGSRSALSRLQGPHAATTLPAVLGPPWARGYTWSSVTVFEREGGGAVHATPTAVAEGRGTHRALGADREGGVVARSRRGGAVAGATGAVTGAVGRAVARAAPGVGSGDTTGQDGERGGAECAAGRRGAGEGTGERTGIGALDPRTKRRHPLPGEARKRGVGW